MTTNGSSIKEVLKQIKKSSARVTIITPTYNRADYIKTTIASILEQTYKDYIYIIIDDGSTDDTGIVVQNLIKDKNNCFYVSQTNIGEAETVNVGWGLSVGEYFLQVNSDDTIEPNLLREMVKELDDKPNCVVAYPDFNIIDKRGTIIEKFKNLDWDFVDALSAFSCYAAAPGAVIRKTAFPDMALIKDSKYKYINDVKMLWGMALRGDFIHIPKTLASWRSHGGSISANRYKSIGEVLEWADEYFSQDGLPELVKNAETACRLSIDRHCVNLVSDSKTEPVITDFVRHLHEKNLLIIEESKTFQKKLMKDILSIRAEKQVLSMEIDKLTNSNSWRLTKPLRQLSHVIKVLIKLKRYKK